MEKQYWSFYYISLVSIILISLCVILIITYTLVKKKELQTKKVDLIKL